jgi:hypothetical protein
MIVPLKLLNEYTIEHAIAVNAKAGNREDGAEQNPERDKADRHKHTNA